MLKSTDIHYVIRILERRRSLKEALATDPPFVMVRVGRTDVEQAVEADKPLYDRIISAFKEEIAKIESELFTMGVEIDDGPGGGCIGGRVSGSIAARAA